MKIIKEKEKVIDDISIHVKKMNKCLIDDISIFEKKMNNCLIDDISSYEKKAIRGIFHVDVDDDIEIHDHMNNPIRY